MISNNGHIQAEEVGFSTLEKTEGTMFLTEQSWRCPWTFSHKPFCKGSSISNLILCIVVGLDHDFGPPCFLLSTFSPEVFHPCFSCHPAMMLDPGTGFWPLFPLYLNTGSSHYQDLHFKHTSSSQKWTHFPSRSHLSTLLTHRPLILFPTFLSLVQNITEAFLSFPSPHFPPGDQEITQYSITQLKL